ncbi:MAG: hypothetical protein V4534_08200 [Myxococcota bacterium]
MGYKISSGMSTQLNPFGPDWSGPVSGSQATSLGDQVEDSLFGKKKPPLLDEDEFPDAAQVLAKLDKYRRKIVHLMGDVEEDYRLQLADGTIAMIDAHGTIMIGIRFLMKFKDRMEVLVGAIGHEIGHRPQRWAEYKQQKPLNVAELQKLCRYEETRADLFAGRALAELGMSCEPMITFLKDMEEGPHPEYFPAKMRADVIREGFREQAGKVKTRQKLWPELEKIAPRGHIGDF